MLAPSLTVGANLIAAPLTRSERGIELTLRLPRAASAEDISNLFGQLLVFQILCFDPLKLFQKLALFAR